jgi:hypothetical protein
VLQGVRPSCQRCSDRGEQCHYVAEPDQHPIGRLKAALDALKQRIQAQEEFVQLLTTVSEADSSQLLARLRRNEAIESLLEAGRQMLSTPNEPHLTTERTIRRSISVDGVIPRVPLESRPVSEHFAAIVAVATPAVLEPIVDLATNLRQLDSVKYVTPFSISSVAIEFIRASHVTGDDTMGCVISLITDYFTALYVTAQRRYKQEHRRLVTLLTAVLPPDCFP